MGIKNKLSHFFKIFVNEKPRYTMLKSVELNIEEEFKKALDDKSIRKEQFWSQVHFVAVKILESDNLEFMKLLLNKILIEDKTKLQSFKLETAPWCLRSDAVKCFQYLDPDCEILDNKCWEILFQCESIKIIMYALEKNKEIPLKVKMDFSNGKWEDGRVIINKVNLENELVNHSVSVRKHKI